MHLINNFLDVNRDKIKLGLRHFDSQFGIYVVQKTLRQRFLVQFPYQRYDAIGRK